MAKLLRWTGTVLGVLILLLALAAAYVWIASTRQLGSTIEANPKSWWCRPRLSLPTVRDN